MSSIPEASPPLWLLAELTYRCPLRCAYCSNPLDYRDTRDALSAADWARVFGEAAGLGVVHVGLTGGEPTTRDDLAESLRRLKRGEGLQGEILIAMELMDDETLARSLREQAEEKLFEIFEWRGGRLRFQTGDRLPLGELWSDGPAVVVFIRHFG